MGNKIAVKLTVNVVLEMAPDYRFVTKNWRIVAGRSSAMERDSGGRIQKEQSFILQKAVDTYLVSQEQKIALSDEYDVEYIPSASSDECFSSPEKFSSPQKR